jgi:hypothetical protein
MAIPRYLQDPRVLDLRKFSEKIMPKFYILQLSTCNSEMLEHLTRATQLTDGRAEIRTRASGSSDAVAFVLSLKCGNDDGKSGGSSSPYSTLYNSMNYIVSYYIILYYTITYI